VLRSFSTNSRLLALGILGGLRYVVSRGWDATWLRFSNLLPHSRKPGVLFIGYVEANLGLGEALRSILRALVHTSLQFGVLPFRKGVEARLGPPFMEEKYDFANVYDINVIHVAVDQLPRVFSRVARWRFKNSYNVLRTYWELPEAPANWGSMLSSIDELWAPNTFVAGAFRKIFPGPITVVPPIIDVAVERYQSRGELGLDMDRFYFMFSFDYYSFPERKNPMGVVRAFRQAFPDLTENVGIIIKSIGPKSLYGEIGEHLRDASIEDARIRIVENVVSREGMLSLIRSSDCYVSLHRAEGFGLGMAEAMALGKAVIGTNFAGNTDFLSEETGYPIDYILRPIPPSHYPWSDNQLWAEPSEKSAAEAMRRVFCDDADRRLRADAGKRFVETKYGKDRVAMILDKRINEILRIAKR
jgi:glycosyltransferase involved in cell wall biosynthesis